MFAIDIRNSKLSANIFDQTVVMDGASNDVAPTFDPEATIVLPTAVMKSGDARAHETIDAKVLSTPDIAEFRTMIREHSIVMRLLLERIAAAALSGEHHPFEDYRWQLQGLADTSKTMGFGGLHRFFEHLVETTCLLDSARSTDVLQACKVFDRWPLLILDYLQHVRSSQQSRALCQYVASPEFFLPMESTAVETMMSALTSMD